MEAGAVVGCGGGEGEGDGEVVLDVWEWGEDVCWEAFCCAGYINLFSSLLLRLLRFILL